MRQHLRWELQESHSLITYFGGLELEEVVVCGGLKKLYQLKQFHYIFRGKCWLDGVRGNMPTRQVS